MIFFLENILLFQAKQPHFWDQLYPIAALGAPKGQYVFGFF